MAISIKNMEQKTPYKRAEYLEFIKFTATPRAFRDNEFGYNTDKAFADHYELNETTLVGWKKDGQFRDSVKEHLDAWAKSRTPDVIACLYKAIIQHGRAAEAKLWMQLFEGFTEKSDSNLSMNRTMIRDLQNANREIFEMAKKEDAERRNKIKFSEKQQNGG